MTFDLGFNMEFRFCQRGEKLTSNNGCEECTAGFYSLTEFSSANTKATCKQCAPGGICKGSDMMGPLANFWKINKNTEMFHACYNEEACLGSVTSKKGN